MNDAPCRDCVSREVGCHAGMREIQGVCRRQEASTGKPLHGLSRGHEQKRSHERWLKFQRKTQKGG